MAGEAGPRPEARPPRPEDRSPRPNDPSPRPDDRSPRLILASGSPRRAEILRQLGLHFDVRPARIDETLLPGEGPEEHAARLAREKAVRVARSEAAALVLGGDTVVVLDGTVLGKPENPDHARDMLRSLSGRSHTVVTALALADDAERVRVRSGSAEVAFRELGASEVDAYVDSGEPLDKAGGYGIQGLGSALVASISGDYYAVVGLPVVPLVELLEAAGWRYRFGSGLTPAIPRPTSRRPT